MPDKFDMGEMPEAPESDELDLEGMDYETPEEEVDSPADVGEITSKLEGLSVNELKEVEAAVADELAKKEESLDEEVEDTEDEVMEEESESEMGGLGAMFS